jgi:hypothetical protein
MMVEGRKPYDIVDGGAGGEFHRALALEDLSSACEVIVEEFAYDTGEPASHLLMLVKDLQAHLTQLRITDDALLTLEESERVER